MRTGIKKRMTGPAAILSEGTGSAEVLARIAKALAHPARIHIVHLLLAKQSCIGSDIVDEVGLAQSAVSEHLRFLKLAGIITSEIEHPRVCYSLNPESLLPPAGLLNAVFEKDRRGELNGAICYPPFRLRPHEPL